MSTLLYDAQSTAPPPLVSYSTTTTATAYTTSPSTSPVSTMTASRTRRASTGTALNPKAGGHHGKNGVEKKRASIGSVDDVIRPHASTSKRKEQNRVAQRAFRKRQKEHYRELEAQVVDMSRKMKSFAKTNSDLLSAMKKLQRENIALKQGRLAGSTGIEPSSMLGLSIPPFDNIQDDDDDDDDDKLVPITELDSTVHTPYDEAVPPIASPRSMSMVSPLSNDHDREHDHDHDQGRDATSTYSDGSSEDGMAVTPVQWQDGEAERWFGGKQMSFVPDVMTGSFGGTVVGGGGGANGGGVGIQGNGFATTQPPTFEIINDPRPWLLAQQNPSTGNYGVGYQSHTFKPSTRQPPRFQPQQHRLQRPHPASSSYQPTIFEQHQPMWITTSQQSVAAAAAAAAATTPPSRRESFPGADSVLSNARWRNAGLQIFIPPEINNHVQSPPSNPESSVSPRCGQFQNSPAGAIGGQAFPCQQPPPQPPPPPQQQQQQLGPQVSVQFSSQTLPSGSTQYMPIKAWERDAAGDMMSFAGGAEVITPMFERPMSRGGGDDFGSLGIQLFGPQFANFEEDHAGIVAGPD